MQILLGLCRQFVIRQRYTKLARLLETICCQTTSDNPMLARLSIYCLVMYVSFVSKILIDDIGFVF